ncbi:MAG TPA: riboflavin synthase [Actinomycetota bacterium]|nr:riboflavin synthase [Actinomycetota bacterium]
MFTGIVEERGTVRTLEATGDGGLLVVGCGKVAEDSAPGASVSVNGACLTVRDRNDGTLSFDLSPETLDRTTLGALRPDDPVNLERPVTLLTRLGGHLVQGHVDGVGTVERVDAAGSGTDLRIAIPDIQRRYVIEKGSVAVDGVSLTVTGVDDRGFTVSLVPHTLAVTTLGGVRRGDRVNIEVDVLAKYVEAVTGR